VSESKGRRVPWWEYLVGGLVLLFGSVYVWWYLTDMEQNPGVHRLPRTAAYLYDWGGKWAVVLPVAAIGTLFSTVGVWNLVRKLKERE